MSSSRKRVLVAVLVYNGREFVPRTLESLARLPATTVHHEVDIVVLDDASPDPTWSAELAELCALHTIGYYCTPRNLGIPRNMSLGLLLAEDLGHDYVIILNSDVVVPANMIDAMVAAAQSSPDIGTVTAWSNASSIFSLPNELADELLSDSHAVDAVSAELTEEFGNEVLTLPTGVGFCLMISKEVIAAVGLFDPVFGRGYCEEVDLCRRVVGVGLRNVLAPGVFVYHVGSATNHDAGLLAPGEKTVMVNEDIIDQRYPTYRAELRAWVDAKSMEAFVDRALARLVSSRARTKGYVLEASWLRRIAVAPDDTRVRIAVDPDGVGPMVEATVDGWRSVVLIGPDGILAGVSEFVGCQPDEVRIHDKGTVAQRLAELADQAGVPVVVKHRYPERV
jgi:GT2 family glycosyltransferase